MKPSLFLLLLAACGGTIGPDDGGNPNDAASDASSDADAEDAPYLACMDANGQLDFTLKTCQSDSECVIEQEQTDCCGTILYVGVDTASVSAFDACETAWVSHFPGCGCASGTKKTEDGKSTNPGEDAAAPAVHCTDFTSNGGVCMTYTP